MKKEDLAFPHTISTTSANGTPWVHGGLTKRELFSAMILSAKYAASNEREYDSLDEFHRAMKDRVKQSVEQAEALLEALG